MSGALQLITCTRAAVMAEVVQLSRTMVSSGKTPLVLCSSPELADGLPEGVEAIDLYGRAAAGTGPHSKGARPAVHGRLRALLAKWGLARAMVLWLRLGRIRRRVRHLLETRKIAAVYVFDDRGDFVEMTALEEAKRAGLKSVLVPYAAATREARLYVRAGMPECAVGPAWSLVFRLLAPAQVVRHQGQNLLFFPPWESLVLLTRGLLRYDPWAMGGGASDYVAVFGETDREWAIRDGIHAARLVVTGQPSLDRLWQAHQRRADLRHELAAQYGLPATGPLIVCAVPHQAEENLLDADTHRQDTEKLFDTLAAARETFGGGVLLSLHPKSRPENYEPHSAPRRLPIARERLADILPAATLFVATYSSTIRWATLMGIPAVVIDTLKRDYTLFDHLPSVLTVADSGALAEKLARVLRDPEYYESLCAAASQAAPSIAPFDGQSARRLIALANR